MGRLNDPGIYTVLQIQGNALIQNFYTEGKKDVIGRRIGSQAAGRASAPAVAANAAQSPAAVSGRSLVGTAWNVEFPGSGQGKTGMIFLFCKDRRYQTIPGGGLIGLSGTYTSSAQTLTTRRSDGRVESCGLAWGVGTVDLRNRATGRTSMKLHYAAAARC